MICVFMIPTYNVYNEKPEALSDAMKDKTWLEDSAEADIFFYLFPYNREKQD